MSRPTRRHARLRNDARLTKGERKVSAAVEQAFGQLTAYVASALDRSGMDATGLDGRAGPWRAAVADTVDPALTSVYTDAWSAIAAGSVDLDPNPYAVRHLEAVHNRLVDASEDVFDAVRTTLVDARAAGASIAEMSTAVDAVLTDTARWKNRAQTIARTEVISANNAGQRQAAQAVATALGVTHSEVAREWIATEDDRTRESHTDADGQIVFGFDSTYTVGDDELNGPGDPSGSPEEVINCRCTEVFMYPGDPDYPADALAAAGTRRGTTMRARWAKKGLTAATDTDGDPQDGDTPTGVIVAALPAASDSCQNIGPEDKHATLCYLGEGLDAETVQAVKDAVSGWVGGSSDQGPFTEDVDSVAPLGDGGAQVWLLKAGTLATVRTDLTALAPIGDLDAENNEHPEFTPHVTIGYTEDEDGTPVSDDDLTAADAVTSITFDRLAVWAGEDHTEYPLTASTSGEGNESAGVAASAEQVEAIARIVGRPTHVVAAALSETLGRPVPVPARRLTADAGDPAPERQEMDAGDPAPPLDEAIMDEAMEDQPGADKFWGVCVAEDSQTGDGRVFAAGSLYWGELPIPFGWQPQDAMGHDDSIVSGRVDTLTRVGNLIAYTGTYDLDGAGWEVQRLVVGGFLRGLSVDVDDVEAELLMPDGTPVDGFDLMFPMDGGGEEPILTVMKGRIRSMVACRVPAMEGAQAFICNGLPVGDGTTRPAAPTPDDAAPEPTDDEAVAAIAAAAARVDVPPLPDPSWFVDPRLDAPTPLTVTASGRVYGHLAQWGVCHIGIDGVCVEAPPSMNDYAYFAVGSVICADGSSVRVGQITMDTGHANLSASWRPAAAHYDNTGSVIADIAVGQDGHGIWMAGAVRASASPDKVAALRAAGKVSGDWREVVRGSDDLELVAALAVNVPGFPIPRVGIGASGARQTALVAAGIVAPPDGPLLRKGSDPTEDMVRELVRAELAAERRRGAIAAAGVRIRARRVQRAAARLSTRS